MTDTISPKQDSQAASTASKSKHLELPTPSTARPHRPQNPLHLFPSTALFRGPHSRNASRSSLSRSRDDGTPESARDKPSQHLPRANPPTASFSGPRPTLINDHDGTRPQSRPGLSAIASSRPQTQTRARDDLHADAVWAEMQKTLADVELSAMNSSHVFGSQHAQALEELRTAQLGLAQAWATSEAEEMVDEEFGKDESVGAGGQLRGAMFSGSPQSANQNAKGGHSRQNSTASDGSGRGRGDLEEETERDIRLARRRREANDRYFRQVNKGVVDVVKKLEEVTTAMRRVEVESRDIWNESSGDSEDDLGEPTETDESAKPDKPKGRSRKNGGDEATDLVKLKTEQGRNRAETTDSHATGASQALSIETESDLLSESPDSKRR